MTIKTLVFTGFLATIAITTGSAHASTDTMLSAGYAPVQNLADVPRLEVFHDDFLMANSSPVAPISRIARFGISREMFVASTGYNSLPEQTDDSPFIAADGTRVYWGMVAANFLPFKTKIKIPDYYGDQIFVVHDRMNRRYNERVDVWFAQKPDALKWGVRKVRIQILES